MVGNILPSGIPRRSLALAASVLALALTPAAASAQSYTLAPLTTSVYWPSGPLAMDSNGNIYGVSYGGGIYVNPSGFIFKLTPSSGGYSQTNLYYFNGPIPPSPVSNEITNPLGGLMIDVSGNLLGPTYLGGSGSGGFFELQPSGTYHRLTINGDGNAGTTSPPVADASRNLYIAAYSGGANGYGGVYEQPFNTATNNYDVIDFPTLLYSFTNGADGSTPYGGLAIDASGNLFGTTYAGGTGGNGVVFELVKTSYTSYSYVTLYKFAGGTTDGANPYSEIAIDSAGNLYGTTVNGGQHGYGTVFELVYFQGSYHEQVLWSFAGAPADGAHPVGGVILDSAGDIFGTTYFGGSGTHNSSGDGVAFELVNSSGSYTEKLIHSFGSSSSDMSPRGRLLMDTYGDLFGTGFGGSASSPPILPPFGANGPYGGEVWELVPNTTTSLQLTSSQSPLLDGDIVIFTASISVNLPEVPATGTVTFSEGSKVLGTVTVANNSASLEVLAGGLGDGSDTITAQFTSSRTTQAGSSGSMVQVVNAGSNVALTNSTNTFNGNQTVVGTVTATSFSGDGSQLKNVVAAGVACTGCITDSQLKLNYAAGDSQAGNAMNALKLGGYTPGSFAMQNASNSFTGDQTIGGGLSATGDLSSAGLAVAPSGKATSSQAWNSGAIDTAASLFNSNTNVAQNVLFRWQAEPAAGTNNTASPAATLNLLYGAGGTPAETGLSINANGTLNFASNQSFPSIGESQVTGLTSDLSNAVSTAETFATNAANAAQSNAETFATGAANTAQSNAQTFATNAANTAQNNAQTFATSAANTAQGNAETFATGAANAAQTAAQNYASNNFLPLSGGTLTGELNSTGVALAPAGTATASQAYNSGALDTAASLFNSDTSAAQNILFRWQAEPAAGANNTASPAATLNLLYGAGATPAETGLSINANGTLNFASNQSFPSVSESQVTGLTTDLSNAVSTAETFATNAANAAQSNAETFATGAANTAQSNAQTFATGAANTAQGNAETFATGAANTAQSNAQTFATNAANTAQSNAQTFATNAANTAQSNAQTFATGAANTAQGNAETFATGAANAAQTAAQTYAGNNFLPLSGGTLTGELNSTGVALTPAGTATASQAYNSGALDTAASLFNSNTGAAQNVLFRWRAEPAAGANNTASPAATLNLLYGAGATPAETGLSVNANGTLNFAPNQAFPGTGTGNGTISGVTAGTGLTGGGTSGGVTLSLASKSCSAGSALTALPYTCSAFVTSGSNVTLGTVTAASFSGNGSGLNHVTADSATTATNLTGNISESQVTHLGTDLSNAVSTAETFATGAASTAQSNAESYSNTKFVPLSGGTMQGTLTVPTLKATGSLAIGGGTPITDYVSVTVAIALPAISSLQCTTFQTPPLTGFTPGTIDTIALGIPSSFLNGLGTFRGEAIFLNFQAWETSSAANTTITLQACNPSRPYLGGARGTVRIDVFKH